MRTLNNYLSKKEFVQLNESQLFIQHGSDLDSVMYKLKAYTNVTINNRINESANNFTFTDNESNAITNVLINVCEDYVTRLQYEINLYEQYLNNELDINENKLTDMFSKAASSIHQNFKDAVDKGKDAVKKTVEKLNDTVKTVLEFIKEITNKAIKSAKELASKILQLFEKFKVGTMSELLEKMGFDTQKYEDDFVNNNDDILNKIEDLKKENIYEQLGNEYKDKLINEGSTVVSQDKSEEKQKWYKWEPKKPIWKFFWGLGKWALITIVIPGFVIQMFPGTFIALLIPLACKIIWNAYSVIKICKQMREIYRNWGTFDKKQKVISTIAVVVSLVGIFFTGKGLVKDLGNMGTILNAFKESGFKLLAQANLGIQPDILQRGFAAIIDMIKEGKFSWEAFNDSFNRISEAFALKTSETVAAAASKATEQVSDQLKNNEFKSPEEMTKFAKDHALDPSKIESNKIYRIYADGYYGKDLNKHSNKLFDLMQQNNLNPEEHIKNITNDAVRSATNGHGGSVQFIDVPGDVAKELLKNNVGNKGIGYLLGEIGSFTTKVTSKIIDTLAASLPIAEYSPENAGGFVVKLGTKDTDNYKYGIAKDGIRLEDFTDKEKLNKIIEKNKAYHEELLSNAKDDEEKEKIQKEYEEFGTKFNDEVLKLQRVVFYGKRIKEDSNKKKEEKTNESLNSYSSLLNYIFEKKEYNIKDPDRETIYKNLDDLRRYIEQQCPEYVKQKDSATGKQLIQSATSAFAGSTQIILRSIFSTKSKEKATTADFTWDDDFTPDKTDLANRGINKRVRTPEVEDNKFGPNDVATLSAYLNTHAYSDITDTKTLVEALIAVVVLKSMLKKSDEITDEVIAIYLKMVEFFKASKTFKSGIAKTWTPGKNWAPLFKGVKANTEDVKVVTDEVIGFIPDENTIKRKKKKVVKVVKKTSEEDGGYEYIYRRTKTENEYIYTAVSIFTYLESYKEEDFYVKYKTKSGEIKYEKIKEINTEYIYVRKRGASKYTKISVNEYSKDLGDDGIVYIQVICYNKKKVYVAIEYTLLIILIEKKIVIFKDVDVQDDDDKKDDDEKKDDIVGPTPKPLPLPIPDDNDDKLVPVLEFVPFFSCWDIADATENGPRKDAFSFKGNFTSYEYIEVVKGTPKHRIAEILGKLLHTMVNNCYTFILDKPCIKDGKKFKVNTNSKYKPDEKRPELGNFTNNELTDILNNEKNAKNYITAKIVKEGLIFRKPMTILEYLNRNK